MNRTPNGAKAKDHNFRSSISVSNKEVCEDEACIGKNVDPTTVTPAEATQPDKSGKKPSGTSMSVGGKEACAEDACIGKK
jgi:hypothetical protein